MQIPYRMLVGYVVFQDDDQLSQRIPFYEGENLIGRNPAKANIPIKRRYISEQHAKLVVKESKVMLLDMGSKNGVYLNDLTNRLDRGTEVRLMPGMTFFISEVKCSIELIPKTLPTRYIIDLSNQNSKYVVNNPRPNILNSLLDEPEKSSLYEGEVQLTAIVSIKHALNDNPLKKYPNKAISNNNSIKISSENEREIMKKTMQKHYIEQNKRKYQYQNIDIGEGKKKIEKIKKSKGTEESKKDESFEKVEYKRSSKYRDISKEHKEGKKGVEGKKNVGDEHKKGMLSKKSIDESKKSIEDSKKTDNDYKYYKVKPYQKEDKKEKKVKLIVKYSYKPKHYKSKDDIITDYDEQYSCETKYKIKKVNKNVNEQRKRYARLSIDVGAKRSSPYPRRSFDHRRILISGFQLSFKPSPFFSVVLDTNEDYDVLVMKYFTRTFKLLYSICKGISVVKFSWMVESEMMKKIQAYERHQFGGQDKVIYEAIQKVRNGFKLFAGYCFYFGSAEDRYHLPWQQIELLVYACGGYIIKLIKQKSTKGKDKTIGIVSKDHNKYDIIKMQKQGIDSIYTVYLILNGCMTQTIDWEDNKG